MGLMSYWILTFNLLLLEIWFYGRMRKMGLQHIFRTFDLLLFQCIIDHEFFPEKQWRGHLTLCACFGKMCSFFWPVCGSIRQSDCNSLDLAFFYVKNSQKFLLLPLKLQNNKNGFKLNQWILTYNPLLLGNWIHGRMKNLEMQHTFRNFQFLLFL